MSLSIFLLDLQKATRNDSNQLLSFTSGRISSHSGRMQTWRLLACWFVVTEIFNETKQIILCVSLEIDRLIKFVTKQYLQLSNKKLELCAFIYFSIYFFHTGETRTEEGTRRKIVMFSSVFFFFEIFMKFMHVS